MSTLKQKLDRTFLGPFYNQFLNVLETEVAGNESLLDIGCGYNPPLKQVTSRVKRSVGIDAFQPSIDKAKKANTHTEFILADVMTYLEQIETGSYDVVMALDLIEHLEKERGYWLMEQMERIARRKVIIFTPNGFVPQRPYDNNPWQEHKSGWSWSEMKEAGYRLFGFGGYKSWRGERFALKYKPRIFWKYLSFYSQIITHRKPSMAYSILCVKDIKK
jgi:SAM-dependent methyltransferase